LAAIFLQKTPLEITSSGVLIFNFDKKRQYKKNGLVFLRRMQARLAGNPKITIYDKWTIGRSGGE
jgi:hypothetical protein